MRALFALAVLLCAVPASAQTAALPGFEGALGSGRLAILETLQAQTEAAAVRAAGSIESAGRDAWRLENDAQNARWRLQDLRRRAEWIGRQGRRDAFFDADLRRLLWDLQDIRRDAELLENTVGRLEREARADAALVAAAERLSQSARSARQSANWLDQDARWARFELGRIGRGMDGWELEREAAALLRAAERIEDSSASLLRKLKG